jgi:hypothetical protein
MLFIASIPGVYGTPPPPPPPSLQFFPKVRFYAPFFQLAHIELCLVLRDLAIEWKRLGRELGYKDSELKKMEQSVMKYSSRQQIRVDKYDWYLLQVLNSWITGNPEKYKEKVLVKALKATGLAEETRRQYKGEPIRYTSAAALEIGRDQMIICT